MTPATKDFAKKNVKRPKRLRPQLDMVINTKASEKFRSLPMKERELILEEFRVAFAPLFANTSVDEFIAERHNETDNEA